MKVSSTVLLGATILFTVGVVLILASEFNLHTLAQERAAEHVTLKKFRLIARSESGTLLPDSRSSEVPGLKAYSEQRNTWDHRQRLWTITRWYSMVTIGVSILIGIIAMLPRLLRRSAPAELAHG